MFAEIDPKIDFQQLICDAAHGRKGFEGLRSPYTNEVTCFLAAKFEVETNEVFESITHFFNRYVLQAKNPERPPNGKLVKAVGDAFLANQLWSLGAPEFADPLLAASTALEILKSTASDHGLIYEVDNVKGSAGLTVDCNTSEYTTELKLVYRGSRSALGQMLSVYRHDKTVFHIDIWRPFCDFNSCTFADGPGFRTGVSTALKRYCAVNEYIRRIVA